MFYCIDAMTPSRSSGDGTGPRRPVPLVHEHERPFWSSGARGELVVQRCADCGRYNHPPTLRCRHDRSAALEWTVVSGRGRVEGWSVNEHQWFPDFPPPYVVALVALDEDPQVRILTNLVAIDPSEIRHGMDVRVRFVELDPGGDTDDPTWAPVFGPVAS
jgi:uncharacterized OB-fold protein